MTLRPPQKNNGTVVVEIAIKALLAAVVWFGGFWSNPTVPVGRFSLLCYMQRCSAPLERFEGTLQKD